MKYLALTLMLAVATPALAQWNPSEQLERAQLQFYLQQQQELQQQQLIEQQAENLRQQHRFEQQQEEQRLEDYRRRMSGNGLD